MGQTRRYPLAAGLIVLLSLAFAATSQAGVILHLTKASFDSAASTTVLEDFEGITPKDTPLASFVSNGVTYTGLAGAPSPNVWVASPGYSNFGAGVAQPTSTSILTANGDEDFTRTSPTPPLAVGFDVYFNGLGTVTTRVTTLEPLSFTVIDFRNLDTQGYYGFVSTHPITSIRFTSTGGGSVNTGIDNIAVSSSVPEPGTLALLGLGLAGLGLRRRREGRIERGLPPGSGRLLAQGRPCCVRAASAAAGVGPT